MIKEVGKMLVEHWIRTIVVLFALIVVLHHGNAKADELIMAHNPQCPYCIAFMAQVEPTYGKSEFAKTYPLTIIDVTDPYSKITHKWFITAFEEKRRGRITGTPTFFVWKGDRETGRVVGVIPGYGGKDWFYHKLDKIVGSDEVDI